MQTRTRSLLGGHVPAPAASPSVPPSREDIKPRRKVRIGDNASERKRGSFFERASVLFAGDSGLLYAAGKWGVTGQGCAVRASDDVICGCPAE